jgi:hypothetical protein
VAVKNPDAVNMWTALDEGKRPVSVVKNVFPPNPVVAAPTVTEVVTNVPVVYVGTTVTYDCVLV